MPKEKLPETITVRPRPDKLQKLIKALTKKKIEENRPTMNNTVEAVLLEYFNI